jgi:transcription initiation factor TFIIIB Brf1 subunit/transcription initiation factor TFIIB
MPDKYKIATVILAAALTWDTTVHYRNKKKFKQIQEDQRVNLNMLRLYQKQIMYLGTKMEEHDIPLSEFDRIIMRNLIP